MRRTKGLFDRIPERENLLLAVSKALRGKRLRADARAYCDRLDENLNALGEQIRSGLPGVGIATEFTIHDPKRRIITAPCFAERVLHHAIMNVCEPEFEKRLIHHSYACRRGKGQFAALRAAWRYAARHGWFLKMDVRKYFESIPKGALLARLDRAFGEPRLRRLFSAIVHAHRPGLARGLPIGSLISQHAANYYLDAIDRRITEGFGCGAYVRYMDDFVVWSADRGRLKGVWESAGSLLTEMGLEFKGSPFLNRTSHGMDFLGHRIHPDRITLNRRSRQRFIRRLREMTAALEDGTLSEREAQIRSEALCAFTLPFGGAEFRLRAMLSAGCMPQAPTA